MACPIFHPFPPNFGPSAAQTPRGARHHDRVETGPGSLAAEILDRPRTDTDPHAAQQETSTGFGQATGPLVVSPALEERLLARRHLRDPAFPFRRSSHSSRSSGSRAPLAASERVVVGRVAQDRIRTDPVLALHSWGPYLAFRSGRSGQTALDHRTRLSGTQAGTRSGDTTKVAAGVDFTIMAPYVLPLMGSWSPSGAVFPPLHLSSMLDYPSPNSPNTSNPAEPRIRPERHNPCSIATLRIRIARFLIQQLPRCPFCGPLRL